MTHFQLSMMQVHKRADVCLFPVIPNDDEIAGIGHAENAHGSDHSVTSSFIWSTTEFFILYW